MAQRQSHSFPLSFLSASLLSALALLSTEVAASGVSTSVFPNSACSGASTSAGGLVGIGRVTLSTGEVETHCGCPSDNLPSFELCPASGMGESVCNSILDLDTGAFTASCAIVSCQGSECPSTVVNTVVVDDEDCLASGKGALGLVTFDGEATCGCASDGADFTHCVSPANGRASCVAVDGDFLGMSYDHKEAVKCGVVCDQGFNLVDGKCHSLAKRAPAPMHQHKPSHSPSHGASKSHKPSHKPSHTASKSHHPSQVYVGPKETTTCTTTGHGRERNCHNHHVSRSHVRRHPSPEPEPEASPAPLGASQIHHQSKSHHHASKSHGHSPSHTPSKAHSHSHSHSKAHSHSKTHSTSATSSPTPSGHHHHHQSKSHQHQSKSHNHSPSPVPSARLRARADEIVFVAEVCAADERVCSSGTQGDFSCVRLDDVTECGGCHTTGDAINCLELPGIQSAICLKGGCVVRSCAAGFEQTSEGACTPKA